MLEEGEVQQSQGLIREEILVARDLCSPASGSSPTYAKMEKNKPMDNFESSEEESLDRYSRKG